MQRLVDEAERCEATASLLDRAVDCCGTRTHSYTGEGPLAPGEAAADYLLLRAAKPERMSRLASRSRPAAADSWTCAARSASSPCRTASSALVLWPSTIRRRS